MNDEVNACYYIELEYLLYIRNDGEKVYITVPAYDTFDQCLFTIFASSTKFKVMYYAYVFEYDEDTSKDHLNIYNQLNKEDAEILINEITEEEYRTVSKVIDRKKILLEEYEYKIKYAPHYTYLVGKEFIPMKRSCFQDADEFDKVKLGVEWIQDHIKHSPKDKYMMNESAADLFLKANKTDKRLNCRNMAVVLNALYLNMSLKSRFIICFQKETRVDNCHFVVEVYISKWNKWILIDSSYGLLFKSEKQMYLSLEEIRNFIANDSFIEIETVKSKINDELYWRNFVRKVYRFRRPINSSDFYDELEQFADLVPSVQNYKTSNQNFVMDNPDLFWRD